MTRTWKIPLVLLLAALLTACGFQLRGAYPLAFDSIYIGLPETGEMHARLKRSIMAGSQVKVLSDKEEAQVMLQVLADQQTKNILSLSAAGRVSEYQLVRNFSFRLVDANNREWLAPAQITIRRDVSYNDDQVLSKESEENLLWRDIQDDLVQQILRRMAAVKAPPAAATAAANDSAQPQN